MIQSSAGFDQRTSFTIEFWLRASAVGAGRQVEAQTHTRAPTSSPCASFGPLFIVRFTVFAQVLISKGDDKSGGYALAINGGKLEFTAHGVSAPVSTAEVRCDLCELRYSVTAPRPTSVHRCFTCYGHVCLSLSFASRLLHGCFSGLYLVESLAFTFVSSPPRLYLQSCITAGQWVHVAVTVTPKAPAAIEPPPLPPAPPLADAAPVSADAPATPSGAGSDAAPPSPVAAAPVAPPDVSPSSPAAAVPTSSASPGAPATSPSAIAVSAPSAASVAVAVSSAAVAVESAGPSTSAAAPTRPPAAPKLSVTFYVNLSAVDTVELDAPSLKLSSSSVTLGSGPSRASPFKVHA